MLKAARDLEFEEAARLRDEIKRLEANELLVANDPLTRATGSAMQPRGRSTLGKPGTRELRRKKNRTAVRR